jgi:cysteine desulfurase
VATGRTYLDWNATAPIDPAARDAMQAAAGTWANPSSIHAEGRRARALIEDCRERIASHLGARPEQLIFVSGGTEALALALTGTQPSQVIASATEHVAVLAAVPGAAVIPVDAAGRLDPAALATRLLPGALVAVQHANNETGVIQPIDDVLEVVRAAGARLLVDAVQTAGKLPLPASDFLAVSAHKLGGPPGVGVLVARCRDGVTATQRGGGQERGLRGGTENLVGIAGFAAALDARAADAAWMDRAGVLRDRLEARLQAAGGEVVAGNASRLATTSMLRMPGTPAATQLIHFDLAGFAVSSGSACSSGKVGGSHVLAAMGVAGADECIRVSLGWTTGVAEVDAFADAWEALTHRRRAA